MKYVTSCNTTIAYNSLLFVFENHVQNSKMMQHRDALMKSVNTTSPYPPLEYPTMKCILFNSFLKEGGGIGGYGSDPFSGLC